MSIYDFLCMSSLDKVMVREEPHGLDTSILGRVADRTTSPAPAGTTVPRASPEEITVTRPDRKVVTKADLVAKQKASTGPEISTNVSKKTRSNKKGSGACFSGQAVGDEVKQTNDGTLDDDDDQRDGSKFAMEGIECLNDVSQGCLVIRLWCLDCVEFVLSYLVVPTSFNHNHVDQLKVHIVKLYDIPNGVLVRSELSRVWRNPMCDPVLRHSDNTVPTSFNHNHVDQLKVHIVKLYDIPNGVLVRSELIRVWRNPMCDPVLRHSDNTVMSIYDFLCMSSLDKVMVREEPHGLDTSILGRVADRTTSPAPAGTTVPRASPEEITVTRPDRKADLVAKQKASTGPEISTNVSKKTRSNKKGSGACFSGQAVGDEVKQTNDGTLDDDDDQRDGSKFAMEGIECLNDVSQGEHINVIPLQTFDLIIRLDVIYPLILLSNKEVKAHVELSRVVSRATRASLRTCQTAEQKISSWDKKHRKYRNERDTLAMEKVKIKEELVGTKSQLEHPERQAEEIRVALPPSFSQISLPLFKGSLRVVSLTRELSQRVVGFIPDSKVKFDRVIAAFPDTTFPFLDKVSQSSQSSLQDIARFKPDRVMPSHQISSATTSLRANTYFRHSTSSFGTFGHTSTTEHLKKKKKQMSRLIHASPVSADIAFRPGLLNQYGPVLPEQLLGYGSRARS
nr:hypothetical protein [Tanacetum cinerariifolium]